MKTKTLFALWAVLYLACAGLGFVPNPEGALRILMILLALAFFIPPLMLVHGKDRGAVTLVRNLAILWLVLTLVLICFNFMSVTSSLAMGNLLYRLLVIISSPMICGQYWIMSLFGWAYLLFDAIQVLRKK